MGMGLGHAHNFDFEIHFNLDAILQLKIVTILAGVFVPLKPSYLLEVPEIMEIAIFPQFLMILQPRKGHLNRLLIYQCHLMHSMGTT